MSKGIGITMADERKLAPSSPPVRVGADVQTLPCQAINLLVTHQEVRSAALMARLNLLADAFLADGPDTRHALISRMRKDGVGTPEMIDYIIPEVARILGQRWADDTLSFAEVTIGSARLQETVRALVARELSAAVGGLNSIYKRLGTAKARRVLLIIPRPEQHTLGAFVAADQFRRLGFEVDILVDHRPRQVALTLRKTRYAMIGITIAGRRSLATVRELVDIIRSTVTRVTPIVLGGFLVEFDQELKKATGVDHVAASVAEALKLCGLNIVELDPPHIAMASLSM